MKRNRGETHWNGGTSFTAVLQKEGPEQRTGKERKKGKYGKVEQDKLGMKRELHGRERKTWNDAVGEKRVPGVGWGPRKQGQPHGGILGRQKPQKKEGGKNRTKPRVWVEKTGQKMEPGREKTSLVRPQRIKTTQNKQINGSWLYGGKQKNDVWGV